MIIVGCRFHPSYQQVAVFETEAGETVERSLSHATQEAGRFYGRLAHPALVGMKAIGNSQ
jgi:hypothetical protein